MTPTLPIRTALAAIAALLCSTAAVAEDELAKEVERDYVDHLRPLFLRLHQRPELSMAEHWTAATVADELRAAGFEVEEGVGETGVVALLRNGEGPTLLFRGDMDGLPIAEDSGLDYASTVAQEDPGGSGVVPVMHACGHDVHVASLVGTGRQMARLRNRWSGTLMLVAQPGEERFLGAAAMRRDRLYERFGTPDVALAFHVTSQAPLGVLNLSSEAAGAGASTVDVIVHGIGSHGASPHDGIDPIVLASQIVLAFQTIDSRVLAPREAGVVSVGAFHAGSKHNVIPDRAHLKLTIRYLNDETREKIVTSIERIAHNLGRAAGLGEEQLPEVIVNAAETAPPLVNDAALTERLRAVFAEYFGEERLVSIAPAGMGAEDFPHFTTDPPIPSVYYMVGGGDARGLLSQPAGRHAAAGRTTTRASESTHSRSSPVCAAA